MFGLTSTRKFEGNENQPTGEKGCGGTGVASGRRTIQGDLRRRQAAPLHPPRLCCPILEQGWFCI